MGHIQVDVSSGQSDLSLKSGSWGSSAYLRSVASGFRKAGTLNLLFWGLCRQICHPIRSVFSWASVTWLPIFSYISLEHWQNLIFPVLCHFSLYWKLYMAPFLHTEHTWQGLACISSMLYAHSAVSHAATLCPVAPPSSSVHGIFQARILGWIAISSSRGSSWPMYVIGNQ